MRPAIVTGGRTFVGGWEAERWLVLQLLRHDATVVFHGDSGERADDGRIICGADIWAADVAERRLQLPTRPFPAAWKDYGDKAGPIRNWLMACEASSPGRVPVLLAFPGGSGTGNMIGHAAKRGIPIERWKPGVK